ncbi:hypothetical protein B5S28_g3113 [[Candida] boidinii]|nr:hypothetical protein B5S28_g3113 [[Candida] boidinii]
MNSIRFVLLHITQLKLDFKQPYVLRMIILDKMSYSPCHPILFLVLFSCLASTVRCLPNDSAKSNNTVNSISYSDDTHRVPLVKISDFQNLSNLTYIKDSHTILGLENNAILKSENDGAEWSTIELPEFESPDVEILDIRTFNLKYHFVIVSTNSRTHYYSSDEGITWNEFNTEYPANSNIDIEQDINKEALITLRSCQETVGSTEQCAEEMFYIAHKSLSIEKLNHKNLSQCRFSTISYSNLAANHPLICIKSTNSTDFPAELVYSYNFFNKTTEVYKFLNRKDSHIVSFDVTEKFVIIETSKDKSSNVGALDIYIGQYANVAEKVYVDQTLYPGMYEFFSASYDQLFLKIFKEGSNKLIFDLYVLNENVFSKVNENLVSIEYPPVDSKEFKTDAVIIASKSIGFNDELGSHDVISQLSPDSGDTWKELIVTEDINCTQDQPCHLHLFLKGGLNDQLSRLERSGLVIGIGNTGDILSSNPKDYKTYLSSDGGFTWRKIFEVNTKFSTGNFGNLIVAFHSNIYEYENESSVTSNLLYSLDSGRSWQGYTLDNINNFDSISFNPNQEFPQFVARALNNEHSKVSILSIDFSKTFDGECRNSDIQNWSYHMDQNDTTPVCTNGVALLFPKRRPNSFCLLKKDQLDVKVSQCSCSAKDTICNEGFRMNLKTKKCDPIFSILSQKYCYKGKKKVNVTSRKFKSPRLCTTNNSDYKLPKHDFEFDCTAGRNEPTDSSGIVSSVFQFDAKITNIIYLNPFFEFNLYDRREATGISDETLLIQTDTKDLYVSHDGGLNFTNIVDVTNGLIDRENVKSVYLNPYWPNNVYILTNDNMLHVSTDRAYTFSFTIDQPFVSAVEFQGNRFTFDKASAETFIWYGFKECNEENCKVGSVITIDGGRSFTNLLDNASVCHFVGTAFDKDSKEVHRNLIICDQHIEDSNYLRVVSSEDWFDSDFKELFSKTIGSAVTNSFLVVAKVNEDGELSAQVTQNGKKFAEAAFPKNMKVNRKEGYTILDSDVNPFALSYTNQYERFNSNKKPIFMHTVSNSNEKFQFGPILKSNYNGTHYVLSIDNVYRDESGYVDYEPISGLEGAALVNVVTNPDAVASGKESSQLKTFVTHNDGSQWNPLMAPKLDSNDNKYECDPVKNKSCSLNLHSFTERTDFRDSLSSGSAVGLMFGVGNVGEYLKSKDEGSVFFTRDGGVSWKEIVKGNYIWEYGDQGSILVLVKENEPTRNMLVSIDGGESWFEYGFSKEDVVISDIMTVPSDTARRLILIPKDNSITDYIFTIDFQDVFTRQCNIGYKSKDIEYWTPKNPHSSSGCFLGRKVKYARRKAGINDCFIGAAPIGVVRQGESYLEYCKCTREDYECDYNYELATDGTCKLINGLKPIDNSQQCQKNRYQIEYFESTGYRRIPTGYCYAGLKLDEQISHPCPGREKEYKDRHSTYLTTTESFIVIAVPIVAFFTCLVIVYTKGIKRNGGFALFTQIRLSEENNGFNLVEENLKDKIINTVVKIGFVAYKSGALVYYKIADFVRNRRNGQVTNELEAPLIIDDDDE